MPSRICRWNKEHRRGRRGSAVRALVALPGIRGPARRAAKRSSGTSGISRSLLPTTCKDSPAITVNDRLQRCGPTNRQLDSLDGRAKSRLVLNPSPSIGVVGVEPVWATMTEGTSPGKEDLGSRPAGVPMECAYEGEPGRRPRSSLPGDVPSVMVAQDGPLGAHEKQCQVLSALASPAVAAQGERSRPGAGRGDGQNGRWAGWPCGRSRIRASTIARPRAWRPGTRRSCRAIRSGALLRTAPIRSPCWRSRTPPASRTWCRCVMAG